MGGEIFRTSPDRPWSPPSLLYNWYRVFPEGKERPGRDADPSPPSTAVGHGRAELHLCSPYGPYGLYRVSVPVQSLSACTRVHFIFVQGIFFSLFIKVFQNAPYLPDVIIIIIIIIIIYLSWSWATC